MRCIGHLDHQSQAEQFGHYLVSHDIENQVDPHSDGHWEIWVLDEDRMDQARALLQKFLDHPQDPAIVRAVHAGLKKEAQLKQEQAATRARIIDARIMLQSRTNTLGWATISLIVISVGIGIVTQLGKKEAFVEPFLLIMPRVIQQAEIWRLFTPMFIHFGLLHLFFNMWWMKDLGSAIEHAKGPWTLLGLSFIISIVSNVAQFYMSGPSFGGMSGVVFGLFCYMWMQGKFNPRGSLHIPPQMVQFMMIWFVLCLTGLVGHIANTVHGVGAFVGLAWGYLSAKREAGQ